MERTIPFTADDGFQCNLINVRGERPPVKGPLILVHGAGVRANLFRSPAETTIVDYFVENEYDVWLLNWRASIRSPSRTLDTRRCGSLRPPVAVRKAAEATAGINQSVDPLPGITSR
jgi:pimeloyl-ACP methyl ester carboxylesterase